MLAYKDIGANLLLPISPSICRHTSIEEIVNLSAGLYRRLSWASGAVEQAGWKLLGR